MRFLKFDRFSKFDHLPGLACIAVCVAMSVTQTLSGQIAGAPDYDPVVAEVGDHMIFLSQVEWQFQKSFGERELAEPLAKELRTGILKQLVRQQLALIRLSESEYAANADEVNLGISRLGEQARKNGSSLEGWLADNKQSRRCLRFNLEWQISWQRYTDAKLTDEVLRKYFERHRTSFDGTKVNVSHLLLSISTGVTDADLAILVENAASIREKITSGQLTWSEAVKQHSSAPTATEAGELGWIEYERPMPPEFTKAAFALAPDEISPPVQTSFGVHLIKCLAVEKGVIGWYEIRKQIKAAAVQDLFILTADRQEKTTEVRLIDPLPWSATNTSDPSAPETPPDKNGK